MDILGKVIRKFGIKWKWMCSVWLYHQNKYSDLGCSKIVKSSETNALDDGIGWH